ncbi:hypothetical protein NECAME_07757 [Necator americanus]|uniref:Uncharacterized protein n=1 Tax=Necator americanus TaxID=51031 RepID=W2TNW6_NECAM|nr:hypothetical protein NECAME_07757 [Necator americanus]ETN82811.1 hypothetical protein NECAME_07757 [Necator americanus]
MESKTHFNPDGIGRKQGLFFDPISGNKRRESLSQARVRENESSESMSLSTHHEIIQSKGRAVTMMPTAEVKKHARQSLELAKIGKGPSELHNGKEFYE